MPEIVALESKRESGKVKVSDSKGTVAFGNNPHELLAAMVAPYGDCLKVCWSMQSFLAPLMKLLPKDVVGKLNQGESAWYGDFKLFYGVSNRGGGVFGVTWQVDHPVKEGSNIVERETFESNIYDIGSYFPNETAGTCAEIKAKGDELLTAFQNMGMTPTKLTSVASVYEESILRKLNPPTIYDMPEAALEMAEWCASYCREWRSTYRLGYFPDSFDYDLSSAYASVLAKLPNLRYAHYVKTDGSIPKNVYWGIMKGEIDIWGDVSPIVHADGKCYRGKYHDLIATNDLNRIRHWNIGDCKPEAGWFIVLDKFYPLFDYSMRRLFDLRQGSELQNRLSKNAAASLWGKFIETHINVKGTWKFGDYYMPPIAAMTTSGIRCLDCDFIYENSLQESLVSVTVDGCLTTKKVESIGASRKFGEWRLDCESPALVFGSSFQWVGDKKPLGVTLPEMVASIWEHPNSRAWHGVALRFLEHDRQFPEVPKNGHDIFDKVYESKAFEIENV